ncbi:MAG: AAA family ATPase [Candidatus Riflebacteria bacterium]|nr:AAA family ATPase [Candidatus Riflebacteria bacterium]
MSILKYDLEPGACENRRVHVSEKFDLPLNFDVPVFDDPLPYVPEIDSDYFFDTEALTALLIGFALNRKILLHGLHGVGKSTHIEQVAARLGWPCLRLNLDSQMTRMDLIGKDRIRLSNGLQITDFQDGILSWAVQRPVALVLDEYDAARPEVLFIFQRILENNGKLILPDGAKVINPHTCFRLFATANTLGMGDSTGIYHGTHPLNQGQLDRWNLVSELRYLDRKREVELVTAKISASANRDKQKTIEAMVLFAGLTREGFQSGDVTTIMSPRGVITWAENWIILSDIVLSFKLSFFNRCDHSERQVFSEYFQRAFGIDL